MFQNIEDISQIIRNKAKELGFLDCGIAKACFLSDEKKQLKQWLDHKMNGEMAYMANHFDKRVDPRLLVEHAQSVISVLLNYYTPDKQSDPGAPVLSKYAYGVDYHFVMKDKLAALLRFIQKEIAPCAGRCFVDSAPVFDRAWAARAGLGWIGKNTNLISPVHGSFFFIGELVIDLEIQQDERPIENHCGNCSRCIDACPTKALVAPYTLDARKCISYQTIENKGEIDPALKDKFGNRVFGCDICQDVCPWNSKSKNHTEQSFFPSAKLMNLTKKEWHEMDEVTFNGLFLRSAVKRTRFEGLKRNLKFLEE
jgi:epoxyqueuosine reductase